ncbi:MAG TPA: Gfo/Idh/MocA family oxidoreductase [Chthoniobacterales bacterium]
MSDFVSAKAVRIPVGIVGAGRSRGGLGPFLAQFLEQEGCLVAGISGRSVERAIANAEAIGRQLGHEVKPFASPAELCANGISALVIASPAEFHLEALQAAAGAGLPTLCEKPLVHENHGKEGAEQIEIFSRKRLPLVENCQWPYLLPAFFQLHGPLETAERLTVEMGLGPPRPGREMVQNVVSHLLSVIQAVAPMDSGAVVTEVSIADPPFEKRQNLLRFVIATPKKAVEGSLHLEICEVGPRPAWLAINGHRMDRRVRPGYAITFSANGTEVAVADPTPEVVRHFLELMRGRESVFVDEEHDRIRQRLSFYRQILQKLE